MPFASNYHIYLLFLNKDYTCKYLVWLLRIKWFGWCCLVWNYTSVIIIEGIKMGKCDHLAKTPA